MKSVGRVAIVLGAWLGSATPGGAVPCAWTPLASTVFSVPGGSSPKDITWDASGNVIVVGYETTGDDDWEIRRYDPTLGTLLASTVYSSPGSSSDVAQAVVLDGSGNVVVAGFEFSGGIWRWLVRRYDADLTTVLASTTYAGAAGLGGGAYALAISNNGDVVVFGEEVGTTGGNNWRINRYDAAFSTILASTSYDGPGGLNDMASAIAIDAGDNIVAAGAEFDAGGDQNWRIRRYDAMLGTLLASTDFDTPGTAGDYLGGMAIHPSGDIYVGGIQQPVTGSDWRIQRYDSTLAVVKSATVYHVGSGDQLWDLAIDPKGHVVAIGVDYNGISRGRINVYDAGLATMLSSTRLDNGNDGSIGLAVAADPATGRIAALSTDSGWRMDVFPPGFGCLQSSLVLSPAGAEVGMWMDVRLTVTNSGWGEVTGVGADLQLNWGGGLLAPVASPVGGPLTLAAGGATMFTWTYSVSGSGPIGFTVTVSGTDSANGDAIVVAGTLSTTSLAAAAFSVGILTVPSVPVMGQLMQVRVSVTNTGGVTAQSVTPALQVNVGGGSLSAPNGPVPATIPSFGAGATTTFVWTFTLSGSGDLGFTATISGVDAGTGNAIATSVSLSTTTVGVVVMSASPWLSPDPPSVGQGGTITFCVTNTGGAALVGASATVFFSTGSNRMTILSGPVPLAPFTITAGGSAAVVWTWSAAASGFVVMTVSLTGTDAGTGAGIVIARQHLYSVQAAGSLASTAWATPSPVQVGNWVNVRLTLTNTGGIPVTGVMAQAQGSGNMIPIAGPLPPGPVTLAPGSATTFVWTYSVSGAGSFALTASAYDSGTGNLIQAYQTLTPVVTMPALLNARLLLSPGQPVIGQVISVRLSVTNTGGIAAQSVSPVLEVNTGAGLMTTGTGPVPAVVPTILPGGTTIFSWSYTVTGVGTISFTATASGVEAGTGNPLAVAASVSATTLGTVLLTGTLMVQPAAPAVGMMGTLSYTVSNSGLGTLVNATATLYVSVAGLIARSGPVPGGPLSLPPGGSQTFLWSCTYTGAGSVTVTVSLTGSDAGTGSPVVLARSGSFTILPGGLLTATLSVSPSLVTAGQWVTLQMTVSNSGGVPVTNVQPALLPSGALSYVDGPLPPGPMTLAAGASTVFVWTWSVSGAGGFTVTVTGTDSVTGAPVSVVRGAGVTVVPPASLEAQLSFEPAVVASGGPVTMRFSITNTGGTTVTGLVPSQFGATPASLDLPAGASGTFEWTIAVSGSGPYVFTMTAAGTQLGTGAPVSVARQGILTVLAGPALTAALEFVPPRVAVGSTVTAWLTLTNIGSSTAWGAAFTLTEVKGPRVLVPQGGPLPLGPLDLGAGKSVRVAWTYLVSAPGEFDFLGRVDASDLGGAPVSAEASQWFGTPRAAAGKLVAAPNVLELDVPGSAIAFYARGEESGHVTIEIFDNGGGRIGSVQLDLYGTGENLLRFRGEINGRALPPGMYWAVASGGGVNGRTRFAVVRRK